MDESLRIITAKESGDRIDALLARSVEGLTRSAAQQLLEDGFVTLGGKPLNRFRISHDELIKGRILRVQPE